MGASCIYPLLGVALHPTTWNFLGTEIDPQSIQYARQNVAMNGWENRIIIRQQTDPSQIFRNILDFPDSPNDVGTTDETNNTSQSACENKDLIDNNANENGEEQLAKSIEDNANLSKQDTHKFVAGKGQRYDFCMFNPPFFSAVEEKAPRMDRTCTATVTELSYEGGGEFALLQQMVQDSLILRDRIWWYTSMIGRKQNLKKILKYLKDNKVCLLFYSQKFLRLSAFVV